MRNKLLIVVGETRTGKTTLGRELADALDWYHVETSRPLRRLFNMTMFAWESSKDSPAFGNLDTTLRTLAISVVDAIVRELGPDGYARVVASHLPRGDAVLSGVRTMDEARYYLNVLGAKGVILSDKPWTRFGGLLRFPRNYTVEDVEAAIEELGL